MQEQLLIEDQTKAITPKPYIEPSRFVRRMEEHWTGELGNVPNKALKATWRQIAGAYQYHIVHHDDSRKADRWTVLSPPTGSGKTESTITYCAMLSELDDNHHPGVLIVTRRIADCNRIADRINQFGVRETAVAFHSENRLSLKELSQHPVVVITHRAYELALDFLGHEGMIEKTWPFFHRFGKTQDTIEWSEGCLSVLEKSGTRRLIVIDECIDLVQHHYATLDGLRATLGAIPQRIRDKHPADIDTLEKVIAVYQRAEKESRALRPGVSELMLLTEKVSHGEMPDLSGLIKSLSEITFDSKDAKSNERQRQTHERRLKDLKYLLHEFMYFTKTEGVGKFHTARLIVPDSVTGAVVLDATASINVVYELFKKVVVLDPPKGSRDYRNFTLHVSRDHKVGKNYMTDNVHKVSKDLVGNLDTILPGKDVLVVVHKNVEPVLSKYSPSFTMKTCHWGAIDGSNDWKDCEAIVIAGLSYPPKHWPGNVFMAFQGAQSTDWLNSTEGRPFGDHTDIKKSLERGKLSTDVVQAINRIRVRKTINKRGDCPAAEGYMLLPTGATAGFIIRDIRKQMPGILIKEDWSFSRQKHKVKASRFEEALVAYLRNMETDSKVSKTQVQKDIGMSARKMADLIKTLLDSDSELARAIALENVEYRVERTGKTQTGYFIKE